MPRACCSTDPIESVEQPCPHIKGVVPVQIDTNHIDICKPIKPDFRVKKTISLIQEITENTSNIGSARTTSPISIILSADNNQLPFIKAELESKLVANPNDIDARKGLAYLRNIERSVEILCSPARSHIVYSKFQSTSIMHSLAVIAIAIFGTFVWSMLGIFIDCIHKFAAWLRH
jgi:hypothetical protein